MKLDKIYHAIAGIVIYLTTWWVFNSTISIIAVFIAAIAKEVYDRYRHGKPDVYDFIATVAIPLTLKMIIQ